jgi:hypothetical protein
MRTFSIAFLVLLVAALFARPSVARGEELTCNGRSHPLYPALLSEKPDIPSPLTTADGTEYVVGIMKDSSYTIFPVTVENGDKLDYRTNNWYGKGLQLTVDSLDFPTLATTGRHSAEELFAIRTITGKPVTEITRIGRPAQASGEGFLAEDEDIVSVLTGDNELVQRLELSHPELAKPLFHVFNVIQTVMKDLVHLKRGDAQSILYNGRVITFQFWGAKGWQTSIFNDEILGYWQIEIWRDLDKDEIACLSERYPDLSTRERAEVIHSLTSIHTGEMVPFYIMRYGFYEGHTGYRADPIGIASIFGLRSIDDLADLFGQDLLPSLNRHHLPIEPVE